MPTKTETKHKNGLSVSVEDWAQKTINTCANLYESKMDCATIHALHKLAGGHEFDFVAFRYKLDDTEALAIVTEDMGINAITLGMHTYIKYTNINELCATLKKDCNSIELIAFRDGETTRVYLEPVAIEYKMMWSTRPEETIKEHAHWKGEQGLQQNLDKMYEDWNVNKNVKKLKTNMLEAFDEWSKHQIGSSVGRDSVVQTLNKIEDKYISDRMNSRGHLGVLFWTIVNIGV